jgi:serine-type D-Ala-D-Ala carboxypeptidase (penicillin-binding protein 5/6)
MKAFFNFIVSSKRLKTNFILALLVASFLPARNYYNSLKIDRLKPLVRPINQQAYSISKYPLNHTGQPAPYLSAQSAIVVDVNSKAILYTKNPDQKLLPASITKIMTALIALETYNLDDLVTVKSLEGVEGQIMELELGEQITVENLLYGLLVQSGNDAAIVLAQFHPEGRIGFVEAMNDKLVNLNLHDTQFQNPSGLDEYGHYTTVHDLSLFAAHAMESNTFTKMVNTQNITVFNTDHSIIHELETINQLLGKISGLKGVKTGWTELAGECLVTDTERGHREIITVVLGSLDRFGESQSLIDWAFTNHQWIEVQPNTH